MHAHLVARRGRTRRSPTVRSKTSTRRGSSCGAGTSTTSDSQVHPQDQSTGVTLTPSQARFRQMRECSDGVFERAYALTLIQSAFPNTARRGAPSSPIGGEIGRLRSMRRESDELLALGKFAALTSGRSLRRRGPGQCQPLTSAPARRVQSPSFAFSSSSGFLPSSRRRARWRAERSSRRTSQITTGIKSTSPMSSGSGDTRSPSDVRPSSPDTPQCHTPSAKRAGAHPS
jgi:hypothetical protein